MTRTTYSVLLVDDSEDDRLFIRRSLKNHPRLVVVGEAGDGELAIDYLAGKGAFSDRAGFPFPDVILLDLKMPRMTGYEVLEWLRLQSFERNVVVIVVSGSFLPGDIARSRELGANGYYKKDASLEKQQEMILEIERLLDGPPDQAPGVPAQDSDGTAALVDSELSDRL